MITIFLLIFSFILPNILFGTQEELYQNDQIIWIQIGAGTGAYSWPMNRYYNYSTWQGIYLQSEINTAGNIVRMRLHNQATGGVTIRNVSIYMRETTATTLSPGEIRIPPPSPWVLVWSGNWPNTQTGWQEITFQTPFPYSNHPNSNLIILIVKGYEPKVGVGNVPFWYYHACESARARYYADDNSQPTNLQYSTGLRPNIMLGFEQVGIKDQKNNLKKISLTITQTKNYLKISYRLPTNNKATIKIYNIIGKPVYTANSDKNYFIIDKKRIPSGIYIIKFFADKYNITKKLIIF